MTGEQLKAMLERVGKTQTALAEELNVALRTVGRWTQGTTPIDRVTEYAIRYLLESQNLR